jgi:hypothetical protein
MMKLSPLIKLKYHTVNGAATALGDITIIRDVFKGFQKHLYEDGAVA